MLKIHSCISSLPSNISVSDMVQVFDDVRDKLRDDGTCWIHISNKWTGTPWKYILAMRDNGWHLRNVNIWVRDDVDRDYDFVVLFVKSGEYYSSENIERMDVFNKIGYAEMIGICVDAGTGEKVCRICGKQWIRVLKELEYNLENYEKGIDKKIEWKCDCEHEDGSEVASVCDPFNGKLIVDKVLSMGRIFCGTKK